MSCDCEECRVLAQEIAANAEALAELRFEEIRPVAKRPTYRWLAAAAAIAALAVLIPENRKTAVMPRTTTQTLTVKMLTPDPTVVIYWLADVKEEKR